MVADGGTVYWPIFGPSNSTSVILVTGIQVHITWSDDEQPPAFRPTYQNMPDTMNLGVSAIPFLSSFDESENSTDPNSTLTQYSSSDAGNARIDLNMGSDPTLLKEGNNENISFDPLGASEPGNTGLYISVECTAGHLESSRPALLRYTDRGDEVSLTISITIKRVPVETFEIWVEQQTRSNEW